MYIPTYLKKNTFGKICSLIFRTSDIQQQYAMIY